VAWTRFTSSVLLRSLSVDQSELDAIRHEIQREAEDGFDGSQVAHPDLIALCREVFQSPSRITTGGNRAADEITAADLLDLPGSPTEVTEDALRENIRFGIRYLHSWLQGRGTVEDGAFLGRTATARHADRRRAERRMRRMEPL
jgi:malate synthase